MYAEIMTAKGFDSLWYWLLVSVIWVRAIQWTAGIPSDMMRAARRGSEQAKVDAMDLMGIHIRTITHEFNQFGTALVLLTCFVMASLATLGFWNNVPVLQGMFFIAFPAVILGALGIRLSYRLQKKPVSWDELCRIYRQHFWLKVGAAVFFVLSSMLWALYLEIRPYLEHL
jgi:hypothetical protein